LLTRDMISLRAVEACAAWIAFDHGQQRATQGVSIGADDPGLQRFESGSDGISAVSLADTDDPVVALELKDGSQGIWRVQSVRAAQRRIGDCDGVNPQVSDAH